PALLSRLTPAHPGRGGRLKRRHFLLFPTPSLPGVGSAVGERGQGEVRGPAARIPSDNRISGIGDPYTSIRRPSRNVATGWPRSFQPSKGVLRERLRKAAA